MIRAAVSQRVDRIPARGESRDALDQRLAAWLLEAGCCPFPAPNVLHTRHALSAWLDAIRPGLIVLSGGNDIGEEPLRDATERALLHHAATARLPVLGICRGMQMLAVHAGQALVAVHGHVGTRHQLAGEISGSANSYHRFALAGRPAGYRVLARSEDNAIEAIRHEHLPWEGWMWHPEREPEASARDLTRLRALLA